MKNILEEIIILKPYLRVNMEEIHEKYDFTGKTVCEINADSNLECAHAAIKLGAKSVYAMTSAIIPYKSLHQKLTVIKDWNEVQDLEGEVFDLIYGFNILQHLLNPNEFAKEISFFLKKSGNAYFTGWPMWTSQDGNNVWLDTEKASYRYGAPYFDNWYHLTYPSLEEFQEYMLSKKMPPEDVHRVYNMTFNDDIISRLSCSEMINIFKNQPELEIAVYLHYTEDEPNKYYEMAKLKYSEDDLKTRGITLYLHKKEEEKRLFANRFLKQPFRFLKPSFLIFPPTQGLGSFGDQAMILTTIMELKKRHPAAKIGLLNYFEQDTFIPEYFPEVENHYLSLCYGRLNYESVMKYREIIEEYDHIYFTGADILDGFYNSDQLKTFVVLAQIAKEEGKKNTLLGFSHNGKNDELVIEWFKKFSLYAKLNARDEVSLERLKSFGIKNISLVADTAFLFNHKKYPLNNKTKNYMDTLKKSGKRYIGINIIFEKNDSKIKTFTEKFVKSINIIKADDYEIILIPHDIREYENSYSDVQSLAILGEAFEKIGIRVHFPDWITTHIESKSLTGFCDFVIGNRMHLAISALTLGIPVLSFAYQGKFEGLYKFYDFRQNFIFDKDSFDPEELKDMIIYVSNNLNVLKKQIRAKTIKVKKLAKKNFT